MKTATPNAGAHPADAHVGMRIRGRRRELNVSQEKLADKLGLTFQQVQKYERGANRVSASKLFEIAAFLDVPIGYFFEGLSAVPTGRPPPAEHLMMLSGLPGGLELAQIYVALAPQMRLSGLRVFRAIHAAFMGELPAETEEAA